MATEPEKVSPNLSAIKLLGAMCYDRKTTISSPADHALYQKIIIPLCDDFTSRGVHLTNLILATLILQAARLNSPKCKKALDKAGLYTEKDILARIERVHNNPPPQQKYIKKICLLSRVTIGADINITSIILQRLHHFFPDIPITIIGPNHLPQLFCQSFISHKRFEYQPNSSNSSHLTQWVELQQLIDHDQAGVTDQEFLLIDPDTRLSQLGLLPLAPEQCTHILPSRVDQALPLSLPEITNQWLDALLQETAYKHPLFQLCTLVKPATNTTFTITINFGVGNDANKRISLLFEQELIVALIRKGNTKVILDSGKGQEETEQASAIETFLTDQDIIQNVPNSFKRIHDSISTLASHIENSNLFIGYDSCSGHIATACHTPTIICFKGAPNSRFLERWQPQNQSKATTCLEIQQKQLNAHERSLLIQHIIDIASSHIQTFQST